MNVDNIPNNIQDIYELSPMQQGLLFHTLAAPNSGVYFEQLSCTLNGNLNIPEFIQAWQQVLDRHPILRTAFYWEGLEQPYQVVYQQMSLPFVQLDWRQISKLEQQTKLEHFLQSDRQQGFNLSQAPLLRITLIRLAENTYYFIRSHHHILLDGWSWSLLWQEFSTIYQALCQGKTCQLEPVRPYRDYIAWLQQQDLAAAEIFWRQKLKGLTVPTTLTIDQGSSSLPRLMSDFENQHIFLPQSQTNALQFLARKHQLTMNVLIQGIWAVLLSRYSGEQNVVFGVTSSGRPPELPGVESIVGLFLNTLPLRVLVPPETSLLAWFKQLQTSQIEIRQYEYSPLSQIQRWSEISPGLPLFESIVVFNNFPLDTARWKLGESINSSNYRFFEKTNYPLTLTVVPGSQLKLDIGYDTRRFDAATITRFLEHIQSWLENIVTNPQGQLRDLQAITTTEYQIIQKWNESKVECVQDKCIHQLFEAQVERTPDAIAVVYENQQLTYRQLNQRANQLAYYLHKLGVKAEVLVGIYIERSLEMLIAILGILKAHGAYVPLDPSYPQQRLALMLENSQTSILLSQQDLVAQLGDCTAKVICLDTDWEKIAQENQENPSFGDISSNNSAYVIYTSGSTGTPKGVLIEHFNVVRLLASTQAWFEFSANDVWTLFHSYAFDFSVWEIWGALLYGGRLVVVPYCVSRAPEEFYKLLSNQRVTVLNQTPSAFYQLIQADAVLGQQYSLNLRLIIFGGEALELQSLKPWYERHGDHSIQLVNMYGITETTVHVTYRRLSQDDVLQCVGSVIGRPIPDLQVYLLDGQQQLLPIGVIGEMYVGGAGLARGYLNQPELTAQRFISNPFKNSKLESRRLYRTGDLARYLPNGELEYLGRIDNQVKIRGFRIELGEIETAIHQHPSVSTSVVVVREDEAAQSLVAYIVQKPQQTLRIPELRRLLESKLPNYMVPSTFVTVNDLPLTPNGKVDRKALPTPDTARPELETDFVVPLTFEEKVMAKIWSEVLGIETIGIHDNFFALGGDSIRSIQVLTKAKEHGLECSVQQIFQHQTIHELAREITAAKTNTILTQEPVQPFSLISEEDACRLPDDVEDAYPLTMLQAGMLFHSEYNSDTQIYHNVSSFHLKAFFDSQKLYAAIQQLAVRHPVLRTSFNLSNFSEPLQLVHKEVCIPFQVEDIRHLCFTEQEETLTRWFEVQKSRKFNWANAPLLRFHIHRRSEETFQFSFTEHHAILDGWSVASMLTECFDYYFFLLGRKNSRFESAPANAFRDFVALQLKALQSQECQHYWLEKLNGCPQPTLPRQFVSSQPNKDTSKVRILKVPITLEVSEALKNLAHSAKIPLKSVLLAAHLKVLSQINSRSEVVTLVSSNGRPETTYGTESLGLFLNPLPFRMKLPKGNWLDLSQEAFQLEQELLPFRWYPMAQIQKDLGGQYRFETCFNFTHFHVYQRLETFDDLQLLDGKAFNITDFVLLAEFSLNIISSQIQLSLYCNQAELCSQQIEEICREYDQTITAIAKYPTECHEVWDNQRKKEEALIKEKQIKNLEKVNLEKLKVAKRKKL